MTQTYGIKNLDCASCAQKIQDKIAGLSGVESIKVDFFMQKVTLAAAEADFAAIVKQAKKIIDKVEPGAVLVER